MLEEEGAGLLSSLLHCSLATALEVEDVNAVTMMVVVVVSV